VSLGVSRPEPPCDAGSGGVDGVDLMARCGGRAFSDAMGVPALFAEAAPPVVAGRADIAVFGVPVAVAVDGVAVRRYA